MSRRSPANNNGTNPPPRTTPQLSSVFFIMALVLVILATASAISTALTAYRSDTRALTASTTLTTQSEAPQKTVVDSSPVKDSVIAAIVPANTANHHTLVEQQWHEANTQSQRTIELHYGADIPTQRSKLRELAMRTDVAAVIIHPLDAAQLHDDLRAAQQAGKYVVSIVGEASGVLPSDVIVGFDQDSIVRSQSEAKKSTHSRSAIPVIDGTGNSDTVIAQLVRRDIAALVYLDGLREVESAIAAAEQLRIATGAPGDMTENLWVEPQIVTLDSAAEAFSRTPSLAKLLQSDGSQ